MISRRSLNLLVASFASIGADHYARYKGEKTPSLFDEDGSPSWVKDDESKPNSKWDESKHPRVEKGSTAAHGGQFTSNKQQGLPGLSFADTVGNVGDKKESKKADGIESNEKMPLFDKFDDKLEAMKGRRDPEGISDNTFDVAEKSKELDPREELKQLNTKFAELSDKQTPMVRQQMELEKELRELRTTKYDPLMEPEGLKERNFKMRGVKRRLDNLNEKLKPLTKELDAVRDRSYEVMNAIREQDKAKQPPEAKQAASDMQPGLKNVASRMDQADAGFKDNLKELGGLTDEQAEKAFDYYKENKLFKSVAVMGKHTAKHGAYMDRDVIRKAAGLEPEAKADPFPGSQSGESMKTIPLRERKDYAIGLAKGGMKQTDLADHLMKRGVASVDARKLASDATFAAMVSNGLQEGAKAPEISGKSKEQDAAPSPARSDSSGIVMPSKTVSNDEAKPGDQLGLFGEATKAPAKAPPRLKVDEPKAKQGGLFDTKGNPDQMDLFGDGVMPDDMVYKPEAKPEAKKEETKPTPGENFLASQKKSEVATPKTMDHEAIARKAVDEGTSVWAASKAMGHGGITDLSSEDRNKIAAAHEKLRDEQTKAEEAKRSFVSPARAAAQAKFRARQEAEAKSELAKSHSEKAFEAAEAAESKDATPKEVAKAAQSQLDKDYEYARASEIRNAGEDLKGSARHRVNAWKGLAAAEKDGTAEKLVNREGLHRLEPHDLMTHADKNPVTSLAMHYALRNFPPAPAGQTKTHSAEKNREQYLDAYRAIKDKANELAASTPDHAVGAAVSMLRDFVSKKLNEYRQQGDGSILSAKDKYNPTANLLVKTYNALSSSTYKNKTGVMGRLEEFSKEASEKYGGIPDVNVKDMRDSKEFMENVSRHAKDVIEGQSLNKTFGKESEKKDVKRFDPSEAYVKIATRKGGRDLSKITADPIKAVDHMVKDMGMRGVQWDNSVTDDERKHHAGKALEAIADLADVTGLHPKDIALDGNLGLAIGARGKGTASAHYEPGNKVINLTRANGVGTLAHEWGHAFDHMLNGFGLETTNKGDKVVKKGGYMSNDTDTHHLIKKYGKNNEREYRSTTSDPERMKEFGYEVHPRERSDIRDAYRKLNDVSKGFRERLSKALQDDVNSGKLSAKKANDYWNSDHEIFARSFEQYVMHKMKENGIENTYLAGMSKSHKYWPTPEESKAMAPAFDKIFEQYRKEKHGSGEPIKYSRHETIGMLEKYFAEAFDHYAGKNQMKWDFGDDHEPVSGGKPSRIRSQQKVQEAANNGKLKIVGTTSDHNECERCGRKDLAKTIVVETLDAQGNGTGELHYYGSDCISKIMGKSEKHIQSKVMEADYQKFVKSKKEAYSWQSSEDLEYDESACKLASDLYCAMAALYSVDRYEWREQLHPRDNAGRFSKVRSLVERPDIKQHHSLFALNQDAQTRLYVTDSMKGFRNLIGEASRRLQNKGGDGSEESLWQEIDKDKLRKMLAEVNAKDKEMRKSGGKGLDELFNYNGVIPKMIAERLSGGSRFFDPQKLKAKWHEQAPPPPAPKPDPAQAPAPGSNISIDIPRGKQATHAEPKAPEKPHDGLSTRKRNQVNTLIADLVSDNPEIVEEFRPILINAWKQKIQEVNDHNQAIRQITGTRTPQGMSALIRGARAKTLNPAEKKNFDIMVDSAENSEFAHYLQGRGEDGLLDFLSEGVKGQPDILDEDVAELAISMAGPDFLRGFDPGEAPSDNESEWEETPFSSHAAREYYRANFMNDWELDMYAGPDQMMFNWDESAHPREPKGAEGSKGGEFTKKTSDEKEVKSSPVEVKSGEGPLRKVGDGFYYIASGKKNARHTLRYKSMDYATDGKNTRIRDNHSETLTSDFKTSIEKAKGILGKYGEKTLYANEFELNDPDNPRDPDVFKFGKYEGKKISEVDDAGYIQWAWSQPWLYNSDKHKRFREELKKAGHHPIPETVKVHELSKKLDEAYGKDNESDSKGEQTTLEDLFHSYKFSDPKSTAKGKRDPAKFEKGVRWIQDEGKLWTRGDMPEPKRKVEELLRKTCQKFIDVANSRGAAEEKPDHFWLGVREYAKTVLSTMDAGSESEGAKAERELREAKSKQFEAMQKIRGSKDPDQYQADEFAYSMENYSMPSKAQAEAGNYRMKHVRIAGLDISIETPKGKRRRPEWPPMAADYGYIKGTTGKDGDHLDVFVGPKPNSEIVYVIDQSNKGGGFDEHKIMLGFVGMQNAVECYKRCYTLGWKVGPVTAMTIGQFKNWIRDGKHKKPIEMQVSKYSKSCSLSD